MYNINNIVFLKNKFNNSIDLVTADGGFDFSIDFNNQEKMSYRIIFCEIVSALSIQKNGGNFVCKFFDLYTFNTVKLLYLLTFYYSNVFISKPLTSRPANSEKYIICKDFKGISNEKLNELYTIVKNWEHLDETQIFNFINVKDEFIKRIKNYNNLITKNQVSNIKQTSDIINNEEKVSGTISKL